MFGRVHLLLDLTHAGQEAHHAGHAAHALHLVELFLQIVQVELTLAHPLGGLGRLFGVDLFGCTFDEGDDVAHSENASGDARGIEVLERIHLFADADQLDRLAGDRAHGERRAAAAVAVDTRQDKSGNAERRIERARGHDRVLAGQRVGDEQNLVRAGDLLHLDGLGHQGLVQSRAAGGVEDDDIVAAELGRVDRALRDLDRRLTGDDRERLHADLRAENGQLLHRRRTAGVERGHQDLLLVPVLQALGDLAQSSWSCPSPEARPSGSEPAPPP